MLRTRPVFGLRYGPLSDDTVGGPIGQPAANDHFLTAAAGYG